MDRGPDVSALVTKVAESLGFPFLKAEQQEAITQFVLGKDVFVSLPTGFGKSLCYTLLPLVFDHLRGVERGLISL